MEEAEEAEEGFEETTSETCCLPLSLSLSLQKDGSGASDAARVTCVFILRIPCCLFRMDMSGQMDKLDWIR